MAPGWPRQAKGARARRRAGGAAEALSFFTRRTPRLTRYAAAQIGRQHTYRLDAARERLGYRPSPTSLEGAEGW